MNARLLPYVLILPVTLFLGLFFLYPFVLVAQQAFSTGSGFTLDNFREVTSYWKFPVTMARRAQAMGCPIWHSSRAMTSKSPRESDLGRRIAPQRGENNPNISVQKSSLRTLCTIRWSRTTKQALAT